MCVGDRIDEILWMIDGHVNVLFGKVLDPVVGRPLVALYRSAGEDILLDDWKKGVGVTPINENRETFSSVAVDSPKNPLIWDLTTTIIFSFRPGTFVNLDDVSDASDDLWVLEKILTANIPHEVLPVDDRRVTCKVAVSTEEVVFI